MVRPEHQHHHPGPPAARLPRGIWSDQPQPTLTSDEETQLSRTFDELVELIYNFYRLAPSLLEQDRWGRWMINKAYNREMLAEALCKLEGFSYAPSDSFYWQHGHSTERDFIYVTTASLNYEQLQQLSDEVGPERTLLVLCASFKGNGDYPNLTIKKIPQHVFSRCEWGKDDYSLRVESLPIAPRKLVQERLL